VPAAPIKGFEHELLGRQKDLDSRTGEVGRARHHMNRTIGSRKGAVQSRAFPFGHYDWRPFVTPVVIGNVHACSGEQVAVRTLIVHNNVNTGYGRWDGYLNPVGNLYIACKGPVDKTGAHSECRA